MRRNGVLYPPRTCLRRRSATHAWPHPKEVLDLAVVRNRIRASVTRVHGRLVERYARMTRVVGEEAPG